MSDEYVWIIQKPDGANVISTAQRSKGYCWREFLFRGYHDKTREEFESEGYKAVNFELIETGKL